MRMAPCARRFLHLLGLAAAGLSSPVLDPEEQRLAPASGTGDSKRVVCAQV